MGRPGSFGSRPLCTRGARSVPGSPTCQAPTDTTRTGPAATTGVVTVLLSLSLVWGSYSLLRRLLGHLSPHWGVAWGPGSL